jgi:hypothetical protein
MPINRIAESGFPVILEEEEERGVTSKIKSSFRLIGRYEQAKTVHLTMMAVSLKSLPDIAPS